MSKVDARGVRDVFQTKARALRLRGESYAADEKGPTVHVMLTSPFRIAYTTSSAVL